VSAQERYESVLKVMLEQSGQNPEEFLRTMRATSRELRLKYQNPKVAVDYGREDYQKAYLLRYFFPYELILPSLLKSISDSGEFGELPLRFAANSQIRAIACGCRPCSEAQGLMDSARGQVSIRVDGIDCTSWSLALGILQEACPDRPLRFYGGVDISRSSAWKAGGRIHQSAQNAGLVLLQNCLNELDLNGSNSVKASDILDTLENMAPKGLILLSERSGYYPSTDAFFRELKQGASERKVLILHGEEKINLRNVNGIIGKASESILGKKFFYDAEELYRNREEANGLVLAANLDMRFLAIGKP